MQSRIKAYTKKLKEVKKGFKLFLIIINLTATTLTDSSMVALIHEAKTHINKIKEIATGK